MTEKFDEHTFQEKAETAMSEIENALIRLEEEYDYEVDNLAGALKVVFEEPTPATFVISPNGAARQIWISALATSFKLDWSEEKGTFILPKSSETFRQLLSRLINQQLGTGTSVSV